MRFSSPFFEVRLSASYFVIATGCKLTDRLGSRPKLMRKLVVFLMLASWTFGVPQEDAKLERTVQGQTLISKSDPPVVLQFNKNFRYAGGQVIDIFHVAGAEQHFFIDAVSNHVKRFYWIQFEHYYPDNQHAYDYSGISLQPLRIGKIEFLADARVAANYFTGDNRPGSDSEAAKKLLEQKGFKLEGTFARARLFHLPTPDKRRELMIIYGEAVAKGASEENAKKEVLRHVRELVEIK